jgi:outer membrane protein assembly factor BamB
MLRALAGRWRILLAAGLVLVVAAGAVGYKLTRRPGDVSNPNVEFDNPTPDPTATPTPTPTAQAKQKPKRVADTFRWPMYGYGPDHKRTFQPPGGLSGPFKRIWYRPAGALLEFPPSIADGRLIQLADDGRLVALNKLNGRLQWRKDLGALSASTPAVAGNRVFVTILETRKGVNRGRVVALGLKKGNIVWSRALGSRSESSPLVAGGRVYVGTEGGQVFAFNASNGHEQWSYRAFGAVKGSPTLWDGKLYFGDYGGHVQAIRASNGHRVWVASEAGNFLRGGTFYCTAAVAFGRVYIGSTDGREFSFSARNGKLAWAKQTGAYVYSSAAVQNTDGVGPTVYFGSYDGRFYALNARSGAVRWSYRSGGKISGSPTIVGRTVYFSDLGKHHTYGLSTNNGHVVFSKGFGAFDPVVSDGTRLFVAGARSVSAYIHRPAGTAAPKRPAHKRKQAQRKKQKKQRQAQHKKRQKKRQAQRKKRQKKRQAQHKKRKAKRHAKHRRKQQ